MSASDGLSSGDELQAVPRSGTAAQKMMAANRVDIPTILARAHGQRREFIHRSRKFDTDVLVPVDGSDFTSKLRPSSLVRPLKFI
jgi:hypothetical protein